MQGLFKRIWQWLRRFFGQFIGGDLGKYSSQKRKIGHTKAVVALTDTDYEFLFSQLLEGIDHGWHEGRVLKFFDQLKERGKTRLWVGWLERFGEKVLSSSVPNLPLATKMMRLGELAQSFPQIEPIGQQSYAIGRQLYARESVNNEVWEYSGPDVGIDVLPEVAADVQTETYTLEELTEELQTNTVLAETLAQQLGLDSADPDGILAALVSEFNVVQEGIESQPLPETAEAWLQRGIQQGKVGDLDGAIASWDECLALDPTLIEAWQNRGSALGNIGRLEEAIACFEKVLLLDPEDQQAWFNRGLVWESVGKNEEAIASYQKVLQLNPSFEMAQQRIDYLLSSQSPN